MMRRQGRGPVAVMVAAATAAAVGIGGLVWVATASARPTVPAGDSTVLVRKDVKDLTKAEKAEIIAALKKAKTVPSPWDPSLSYYDQFVWWHVHAFDCENGWRQFQGQDWAGAAHNSPTFLPWHRQYLDLFEKMLQSMSGDPKLALPYWDWTDPASTAAVFADDFMGGDGDPAKSYAVMTGPLRKGQWKINVQDEPAMLKGVTKPKPYLVRNFGAFPAGEVSLPTAADVQQTLTVHRYDAAPYNARSPLTRSFRNDIEGWRDALPGVCDDGWIDESEPGDAPHEMHNVVHIYTGGIWKVGSKVSQGTMAYNTSPNDPVFFFHHANIDRIWAAWEQSGSGHYQPQSGAKEGWNGDNTMWPWFDRTINSWFGTVRNGFRYAELP